MKNSITPLIPELTIGLDLSDRTARYCEQLGSSGTSMISLCQEAKSLPTRSGGARR